MQILKLYGADDYNVILPDELMVLKKGDLIAESLCCLVEETEEYIKDIEEIEDPNATQEDIIRWLVRQSQLVQEEGDDIG